MELKELKLNLLRDNMVSYPDTPVTVTEEEFWRYYFSFLRAKGYHITDKEMDFMALVCSRDPYKSQFKGGNAKELQEKLNISVVRFYQIVNKLLEKKLIYRTGEGRGDILVHPSIRKFQLYIKKAHKDYDKITFVFPFNIKEDELLGAREIDRLGEQAFGKA